MRLVIRDLRIDCRGFEACFDLTLQGERTAIFGPSGAGKTSLLEALAGLRQCRGSIQLDGRKLQEGRVGLAPQERGIGYVPQDLALFPTMTVREHLEFALVIRRWGRSTRARRIARLEAAWSALAEADSVLRGDGAGTRGGLRVAAADRQETLSCFAARSQRP